MSWHQEQCAETSSPSMRIYSAKTERRPIKDTSPTKADIEHLIIAGKSYQKSDLILEIAREESIQSEDSTVDDDLHNDDVYVAVQELSKELKTMARSADINCSRLEYDTINAFFRKAQDDHIPPPEHIREAIKNRSAKIISQTRPSIDLYQLLHNGFDISGMFPGLSPQQQLEILKAKERLILVDRWEEAWNQVRCPKNSWYSLSNADFTIELQRHNALLNSKNLQKLHAHTRESLIELYHSLKFYSH